MSPQGAVHGCRGAYCKQAGIDVVFYVTPIDFGTGTDLLGNDFPRFVRQNVQTLEYVLAGEGYKLLDMTMTLPPARFSWPLVECTPNEHVDEIGRRFIARQVAGRISPSGL